MNKSFQIKFLGLALVCFVLISETNSIPSRIFLRIRREAEAMGSTTMSSMGVGTSSSPMSASASPHASHDVKCDGDHSSLQKSCPNNSTCPMDENTMEKCCHCLSTCCNSSMMGMQNGSTAGPEQNGDNKGKDMGSKMKDAVSSAEGWIKNAGQNIKNSWEKAKDSIKETAGDVKDKVKKGINSISHKVKNATDEDSSDCKEKGALTTVPKNAHIIDGKCSTNKSTTNEDTRSSENSSEEESSSPSPSTTTNAPGMKKMKRDTLQHGMRYPSSSLHGTGAIYTSGFGDLDNSASNEYSWTETKTRTTGTRDTNRRYKRSTDQQKQSDSTNSNSVPAGPSTTESSKSSHSQKTKRDVRNTMYSSMEGDNSAENCNTKVTSASSSSAASSKSNIANGNTYRHKRDYGTKNSTTSTSEVTTMSATQEDGGSGHNSHGHHRRDAKDESLTTTSYAGDSGSTEAAGTSTEEDSEEEPDSKHKDKGKSSGGNQSNSTYTISVQLLGPQQPGSSSNKSGGKKGHSSKAIHVPTDSTELLKDHSYEQSAREHMDHPPVVIYPDETRGEVASTHRPPKYIPYYNTDYSSSKNYSSYNGTGSDNNNVNAMTFGTGRQTRSNGGGGSYSQSQEYPSKEYSQYHSVLRDNHRTTTEMSGWPIAGPSSISGGLLSGNYDDDEDDQDDNEQQYHSQRQHQKNNHNNHKHDKPNHDTHGNEYDNHHFQNEEDGSWGIEGGTLLGSGDLSFDGGHQTYDNEHGHYNSDEQNNSSDNTHTLHHHHHHPNNKNTNNNNRHQSHESSSHNPTQPHVEEGESVGVSSWTHGVVSSGDAEKEMPGACRPLAGKKKCASLQADSTECMHDSDCSGTKKCCFYNCDPLKIVGLCEYVTYTVTKTNPGPKPNHA